LILEAPPEVVVGDQGAETGIQRPYHIMTLSARNEGTLKQLASRYVEFLEGKPEHTFDLNNLCFTANTGRGHFNSRLSVVTDDLPGLKRSLNAFVNGSRNSSLIQNQVQTGKQPTIGYLFTGQGSQYPGMGRTLYETQPTFKNILDTCDEISRPHLEQPLLSVIFPEGEGASLIHETAYTQPALFALEYALAQLLREWGLQPDFVLGHSIGEFAAACHAGAFSLEDGLHLVLARGRLMQSLPRDGTMAVIFTQIDQIAEAVRAFQDKVSIATVNGPTNIVISGDHEIVKAIVAGFEEEGVECRSLEVSHAFHSPLMEPILDDFAEIANELDYHPLQVPLASNLSGEIIEAGEALTPDYWVQHIRQPVLFSSGMEELLGQGVGIFVEIGPSPVLTGMGKRLLPGSEREWLPTLREGKPDWRILLHSLGTLYTRGLPVDWEAFYQDQSHRRIPLPTYPFERKRFWFESAPRPKPSLEGKRDFKEQWLHQLVWENAGVPQAVPDSANGKTRYIIFVDRGGLGTSLAEYIRNRGSRCLLVTPGEVFATQQVDSYSIDPTRRDDYERLFREVLNGTDLKVIHLWSLDATFSDDSSLATLQEDLELSSKTSLVMAQALHEVSQDVKGALEIWFVTRGAQRVGEGASPVGVSQTPLWGLTRSFALEHPDLWGGIIDLDPIPSLDENSQLYEVINSRDREDQVAIRAGLRYLARLQPLQSPQQDTKELSLVSEASYLLTGGTGELGLKISKRLVERGARHLILVSRSQFPAQVDWDQIGKDHPQYEKVKAFLDMESQGAQIHLVSADVSELEEIKVITERQWTDWPEIRGVVHLAGVVEPVMIRQLTAEILDQSLKSKVYGAIALQRLLQGNKLDFFALFSSAASILNSPMLGAYAAANAFLDGFAHYRHALGEPALSINWGFWSEGGMAEKYQQDMGRSLVPKGMKPITAREGLDVFEELLTGSHVQVGVIPTDWEEWSRYQPRIRGLPLLTNIVGKGEPQPESSPPADKGIERTVGKSAQEEILDLPTQAWGDYLIEYIQRTVAQALLMDPEDIIADQNLMELGIDSLMVMELTGNLERDFQITVYPREVFERPTIGSFAEYLEAEIKRLHPAAKQESTQPSTGALVPSRSFVQRFGVPENISGYSLPGERLPGAVFILSTPRAGSTLLRVMLSGHAAIFCPPELHLLPFEDMASRRDVLGSTYLDEGLTRALMEIRGVDADQGTTQVEAWIGDKLPVSDVYAHLQREVAPRILVDKSPSYAISMEVLERAEALFNDPKYIFISRHPYAVMESFVRNRIDRLLGIEKGDSYETAEYIWATMNANVLDFFEGLDANRCHRLKFEDLVADPESEMRKVCGFLNMEFDDSLLRPYEAGQMVDGLYGESRSIGDPNFLKHRGIDPKLGETWKDIEIPRRMGGFARRVSREMAYELPGDGSLRKTISSTTTPSAKDQKSPGIVPISREKRRISPSEAGETGISESLKDELFGKQGEG
jgi:acyl transferase domain-containing protein